MKRFVGKVESEYAFIEGEELLHLKNVMRIKEGQDVIVFCGDGKDYFSKILEINKNFAKLFIYSVVDNEKVPQKNISLFLSAVKRDKLEFIVQKSVELGVKNLYLFESEYSTMKLVSEKVSRYEKIILNACKQCERSDFMKISIVSFEDMLKIFSKCSIRLFANEREGDDFDFKSLGEGDDFGILIGCEGGFSRLEKDKILETMPENISLGKRILRTETAVILLCGLTSLFSGN